MYSSRVHIIDIERDAVDYLSRGHREPMECFAKPLFYMLSQIRSQTDRDSRGRISESPSVAISLSPLDSRQIAEDFLSVRKLSAPKCIQFQSQKDSSRRFQYAIFFDIGQQDYYFNSIACAESCEVG